MNTTFSKLNLLCYIFCYVVCFVLHRVMEFYKEQKNVMLSAADKWLSGFLPL